MSARRDRRLLGRLWPFVRPHRRGFVAALLILGASFAIEVAGPWIVRSAIDGPLAAIGGPGAMRALWLHVVALVACVVGGTALGYRYALLTARAGQGVVRGLRDRLFAHLLEVDPRWHDDQPTGRVVTRLTTDVENLDDLVTTGGLQAVFDLLRIVGLVAALFAVDVALAGFLCLTIPLVAVISAVFRSRGRAAYAAVRRELAERNGTFAELVDGMRELRAWDAVDAARARYGEHAGATWRAWERTVVSYATFFAAVDLSLRAAQAGLLLVGGLRAIDGSGSAGVVVQAWLYFQLLSGPIRALGERYNSIQAALASLERLLDVLDVPAGPPPAARPAPPPPPGPQTLTFAAVGFGYRPDRPVLRGIDLEVPAGTTCALVGPTGAGKTTLLALAARLFDPDTGAVRYGGRSLAELGSEALAGRVALVVQDPVLLPGSLLDNLRWAAPDTPRRRVEDLLDEIGAGRLAAERRGGLDARLDGDAGRLSRGERQLVAFVRALVTDPDLLLLDEATASVDGETEDALLTALRRLRAGRTCLVVAHRLATVRDADQIAVVDGGRIVERGAPRKLADGDGAFARMLRGD